MLAEIREQATGMAWLCRGGDAPPTGHYVLFRYWSGGYRRPYGGTRQPVVLVPLFPFPCCLFPIFPSPTSSPNWPDMISNDTKPAAPLLLARRVCWFCAAGMGRRRCRHLANSTARVSRTTLTLICPGYSISASMRLTISRARMRVPASLTSSGLTITRISRPDWMA